MVILFLVVIIIFGLGIHDVKPWRL